MLFSANNCNFLRSANDYVVLLPLGAIEQHGPHLSVSTDTDIVNSIASMVEKKIPQDVILCPAMCFGSSNHHLLFGGTISLSPTTYTQLIVELVESLIISGFRRIVLLNGHGGNITPVKQALSVLSLKYDAIHNFNLVLATYWEVGGKPFAGEPPMESPALSHACEYETSMMLHLFPEKVFIDEIARAKRPAKNGYLPFESDEAYKGVTMAKQTQFISSNGCSGEPQLGSAAKGEHLVNHAVQSIVEFIKAFKSWPFLQNLAE
jgi:creatinine amidohydrolase